MDPNNNDDMTNHTDYDLHHDHVDSETALRRLRTAGSISISPELREDIPITKESRIEQHQIDRGKPDSSVIIS